MQNFVWERNLIRHSDVRKAYAATDKNVGSLNESVDELNIKCVFKDGGQTLFEKSISLKSSSKATYDFGCPLPGCNGDDYILKHDIEKSLINGKQIKNVIKCKGYRTFASSHGSARCQGEIEITITPKFKNEESNI